MQDLLLDHPTDPQLTGLPDEQLLGESGLNRLRWRCRRGLLENDLFIEKFFNRHANDITVGHAKALYKIMQLSDNDLLDLLLSRSSRSVDDLILGRDAPSPVSNDPEVARVIEMLKMN
jgi:antitoxin CptB